MAKERGREKRELTDVFKEVALHVSGEVPIAFERSSARGKK